VAEREVKLGADPSFRLPTLEGAADGMGAEAKPALRVSSTYFDTDDLRLTRWGVSLRFRTNDGWTVKLPQASEGAALVREELVFPGTTRRLPPEAVDLVRAFVRRADLRPQVRLRTVRHETEIHDPDGKLVADVVDDDVAVLDGRRISSRFRELEVEVPDDQNADLLDVLVARLRESGAGPPDPTPKVVRALGTRASAPPEVSVDETDRPATAGDVVRAAIAASVDRLIRHDPVVRLDADPEGVHQARVATRRLRSDLRSFRPLLDGEWAGALRDELRWLADRLGAVRDGDVLLGRLREHAALLPNEDGRGAALVLAALEAERDRAYAELLDALHSERYLALLDRLVEAARAPALVTDADAPAGPTVRALARQPLRRLERQVRALGSDPADSDLHSVRIRTKRARYALEASTAVLGKRGRAVASAAADLQKVLGEHNDAVVAERWLRERMHKTRSLAAAFTAGELAGLELAAARKAKGRWRKRWKALSAARARART
jgi:CHAD domain-containing protein